MTNISRDNSKSIACGVGLGTVGMLAYHLPVTKGRYINAAYDVVKNKTLDDIDKLNDAGLTLIKRGKVNSEQKLFLSQIGVREDVDFINSKIAQLKESITDTDTIKNLKQGFADSFEVCKKNVVERDVTSMKAFDNIRWTNFGWGVGIGVLIGSVLGKLGSGRNSQV